MVRSRVSAFSVVCPVCVLICPFSTSCSLTVFVTGPMSKNKMPR
jgi:hypothetical protein